MQLSDVFSNSKFLHLSYLWYGPNTLALFETRNPFFLVHVSNRKTSYAIAMFTDIIMERLPAISHSCMESVLVV